MKWNVDEKSALTAFCAAGGHARAKKLTAEERQAIARKGGEAVRGIKRKKREKKETRVDSARVNAPERAGAPGLPPPSPVKEDKR